MTALFWILLIVALVIIGISIIMSPDSNSFSGALVGSSDLELFKQNKERGVKKWLKRGMFFLGICLMVMSIIVRAVL